MKVLFASQRTKSSMRYAPLPFLYLASAIRNAGHVPDLIITDRKEDIFDDIVSRIDTFAPDLLAFSLMTDVVTETFEIIGRIKIRYPRLRVVVGGYFATALPTVALDECNGIDYLIRGEGEISFVELLNTIRDNGDLGLVKGLVYRNNGSIITNPPRDLITDIDTIPFPAYDLAEEYDFPDDAQIGDRSMMVVTSRGCPFDCSFCCKAVYGRTYRRRKATEVVSEIELLTKRYGVDDINFGDALFHADRDWLDQFYTEMKKREIRVHWKCQTRLSDDITIDDLIKMKSNGCEVIHFGIESGSDETLKSLKKGFTRKEAFRKINNAKKAGIAPAGSFVFGYADDTMESTVQTFRFAQQLNLPIVFFKMLNPIPGSTYYGTLAPEDRYYWKTRILPKTSSIDPYDLAAFTRYAQLSYYTRFNYLWENVIASRYHSRIKKMCLAMWIASNIAYFRMKNQFAQIKQDWTSRIATAG